MPKARMRKNNVINGRIGQQQPSKKPRPWPFLSYRAPKPPDRQHRRRQIRRHAEIKGSNAVRMFRHPIPVVEESLEADDGEARWMVANPLDRSTLAVSRVGELAHALKAREFLIIQIGLKRGHQNSVRRLYI